MSFDAYQCNACGKMMDIDYSQSNEFGIVLKCDGTDTYTGKEPCNFRLFFVKTNEAAFKEVTHD